MSYFEKGPLHDKPVNKIKKYAWLDALDTIVFVCYYKGMTAVIDTVEHVTRALPLAFVLYACALPFTFLQIWAGTAMVHAGIAVFLNLVSTLKRP